MNSLKNRKNTSPLGKKELSELTIKLIIGL
jgi:hypothetical protein